MMMGFESNQYKASIWLSILVEIHRKLLQMTSETTMQSHINFDSQIVLFEVWKTIGRKIWMQDQKQFSKSETK